MPIIGPGAGSGGKSSVDTGFFTGSFSYGPNLATGGSPLVISIGTGPDSLGIAWIWTGIKGWDSPDVSGSITQRAADHGGWPISQYYAPRVMTISIEANAPNQFLRDIARAELQQAIPVNDLCTMVYNEPIPKQVMLRRSGAITETLPNLTDVQFSIVCTAPDPRKYTAQPKASPSGTLVNSTFSTVGVNQPVQTSFQIFSTSAWASGVAATINWYTSAHVFISASTGTVTALAANTWTTYSVSVTPANIPATAAFGQAVVNIQGTPTAGQAFFVDANPFGVPILSQGVNNGLNANSNFSSGSVSPWTGFNSATLAWTGSTFAPGYSASMQINGNGTTANPQALSEQCALLTSFNPIGQASGTNNVFLPSGITPGTVTAFNNGTFETRPQITIIGPANNPAVKNRLTGQTVSFSHMTLRSADKLVIDFDQRFGLLNGGYVPADIQSSWWTLWPGFNVIELLGANVAGGAQMNVAYADAWI